MLYGGAMAFFITEKATEEWLVQEVRDMLMPDGTHKPVRAFKITWSARDFLDEFTDITEEEIAKIAQEYAAETGKPYEEAYFDTIGHLENGLRKRFGIDE
jgi:hypothetical protein